MADRIGTLQERIAELLAGLRLGRNDVLICEEQTTMRDPRAAFMVEQVRGIFETLARSRDVVVPGRLNPRSVQHEVMGLRGRQLKREVVKEVASGIVKSVYGQTLQEMKFSLTAEHLRRNQDIVDAILIGSLGLARLRSAAQSGMTPGRLFEKQQIRSSVRRRVTRSGANRV